MKIRIACTAMLLLVSLGSGAQEQPSAPPATAPAVPTPAAGAAARSVVLHANALLPLRFMQSIGSDTHHPGDTFSMEVTDDIIVDDVTVIPAGSIAEGEVIHAQPAGMLGKAGELIVSARYVTVGDREIRLRSTLGHAGKGNIGGAFIIPFVRGKQATIPENAEVVAKIAADETFMAPGPTAH